MSVSTYNYSSPIGCLHLESTELGLSKLQFSLEETSSKELEIPLNLRSVVAQLNSYFDGSLKNFQIEFDLIGTPFQLKVWAQLIQIQYNKILTYGELAEKVGGRNYMRAVGGANNKNPIAIIIPCHRVLGADGKMIGYAGGIDRKEWLLRHEGAILL